MGCVAIGCSLLWPGSIEESKDNNEGNNYDMTWEVLHVDYAELLTEASTVVCVKCGCTYMRWTGGVRVCYMPNTTIPHLLHVERVYVRAV